MQRLEVSGVVRLIYRSFGVKGLMYSGSKKWTRNVCFRDTSVEAHIYTKLCSKQFHATVLCCMKLIASDQFLWRLRSPVWLALLNWFMTQRASWLLTIVVQNKKVAGKGDVLAYIIVQEWLSCTVLDDWGREDLRNICIAVRNDGRGAVEVARIDNSVLYHYSMYLVQWSHLWRNVQTTCERHT